MRDEQEKSCKLQSQLSVSRSRLLSLQRKNEQLLASQQQQRQSIVAEVDTLKQQFSKLHSSEKRRTETVRKFATIVNTHYNRMNFTSLCILCLYTCMYTL